MIGEKPAEIVRPPDHLEVQALHQQQGFPLVAEGLISDGDIIVVREHGLDRHSRLRSGRTFTMQLHCIRGERSAVPRVVDHEARRVAIAEAIFEVIGSRGLGAVSLRDVAAQAGVSMGAVQHYFDSKEQMLLFALGHMRDRALARMSSELTAIVEPSARETVRAAVRAMLPLGEPGRQEAVVAGAFYAFAT